MKVLNNKKKPLQWGGPSSHQTRYKSTQRKLTWFVPRCRKPEMMYVFIYIEIRLQVVTRDARGDVSYFKLPTCDRIAEDTWQPYTSCLQSSLARWIFSELHEIIMWHFVGKERSFKNTDPDTKLTLKRPRLWRCTSAEGSSSRGQVALLLHI